MAGAVVARRSGWQERRMEVHWPADVGRVQDGRRGSEDGAADWLAGCVMAG